MAAWGTSQQSQGEMKVTNATVRMIARVTLSGDAIRIRLDNTFGKTPVTFSNVTRCAAHQRSSVGARSG